MLPLKIALRYLVAKKSHAAVNVITMVSMAGVAVATMAMVVVLSVFNGFADLAAKHLSMLDAELVVRGKGGKVISDADSVAAVAMAAEGVKTASPVIEERGLIVDGKTQTPVLFKAVAPGYDERSQLEAAIIDGHYATSTYTSVYAIQISVGIANHLMATPSAENVMQLYVPRRLGTINPANPATAFNAADCAVSAVFQVDQPDIDSEQILIPLDMGRDLMGYDTEANSVELTLKSGVSLNTVKKELQRALPGYDVLTRLEQRTDAFRMISVEKWVTFMMLIFILVIALFNVVSTLSLLVIEKRTNMATLRALGASNRFINGVFICEGWLVTLAGGIAGMILGVVLTLVQQWGKVIKLGGDPSQLVIDTYPVRLALPDLLVVLAVIAITGLITSSATTLLKKN